MTTFAVEPFATMYADAIKAGLVLANWQETGGTGSIAVDAQAYEALEAGGHAVSFTARTSDPPHTLVGYGIAVQGQDRHRAGRVQASIDVVYLSPAARTPTTGYRLLAFMEAYLLSCGVDDILHQVTPTVRFGRTLERMGYKAVATIYLKENN